MAMEGVLDPVSRAIIDAPADEEPVTAEEALALEEAREWLKHNKALSHEQCLVELGITVQEIENLKLP